MSNAVYNRRRQEGQSVPCATSKHDECHTDGCPCGCHRGETPQRKTRAAAAAAAETEPKRPDLKPGARSPVSAGQARQIKSELGVALWGADQAAARLVPQAWNTPEDRLSNDERTQLVGAIYAELEAVFPRALVWLARVAESATHAQLLYVVALVAAPRLARHGLIPEELASAICLAPLILSHVAAEQQAQPESTSATVDSERASNSDWPEWHGEIDISGAPVAAAPLQNHPQKQAGFGDLRHADNDPQSAGNGRHTP